jgi:hypothetical protein
VFTNFRPRRRDPASGNVDLSTMFDAIAAFDPGDAAAGVEDSGCSPFGGIFEGLDGLFSSRSASGAGAGGAMTQTSGRRPPVPIRTSPSCRPGGGPPAPGAEDSGR